MPCAVLFIFSLTDLIPVLIWQVGIGSHNLQMKTLMVTKIK